MERKNFLKGLGFLSLGTIILPVIKSCNTDNSIVSSSDGSDSENSDTCDVTPSETEGPFPTHTPSSLVTNDIRSDRTGVLLNIVINLKNANASDASLSSAIVDIWHCDKDGNYSEYGGTGMQSENYTAAHFLRGRQTTDANGVVSFTSIFPGWYNGRATHIHVHIYNSSGNSLLVTQIAFPEGTNSAVATVSASTENGYTKGLSGYTYNTSDNVFSDSVNCELGVVSGNISNGYTIESTIKVSA